LWAESWKRHGWKPRVLTDRVVRQHPKFKEFSAAINLLPTVNNRAYENACYLRWLALQGVGGGWMTDYDVINFGFKSRRGKGPVEMLDCTYVPCAVWANIIGASCIAELIRRYRPGKQTHVSDMMVFKTQFDKQSFGNPGTECVEFKVPGWDKAPLVHFPAGKVHGFPSKVEAIQFATLSHA
jgi:hypothetical protein